MRISTQVWHLEKNGNAPDEYEDAFWPPRVEQDAESFHCAVADGAAETSFSGQWAAFLAHAYCRGEFSNGRLWQAIPKFQRQWLKKVSAKPLPWYAEEKMQMGAYSSLVGLTLYAPGENQSARWEALAVGDSCLFQIRNEELKLGWLLEDSTQFNNRPILLSTKPENNEGLVEQTTSSDWITGDLFFLMTDAIAQWYLRMVEQGGLPKEVIPNFSSQSFPDWIADLRSSEKIRNDDVTLMRVDVI